MGGATIWKSSLKATPVLAVFVPLLALAAQVQPKTYSSPSGEWTLFVDPTKRLGTGDADCVLSRGGRAVWSERLPFTLIGAVVADDGFVGGYCYGGTLRVLVLGPGGEVLLKEQHERRSVPNHRMLPAVVELVLLPERFVLRVDVKGSGIDGEEWWLYDLHEGRALRQALPRHELGLPERLGRVCATRAVPGTQLWLVQFWSREDGLDGAEGAVFALLDDDLRRGWTLDLPRDYELGEGLGVEESRLRREILEHGAILRTFERGFELRLDGGRACATFAVEPASEAPDGTQEGWRTIEVARVPYEPPVPPPGAQLLSVVPQASSVVDRLSIRGSSLLNQHLS